MGPYYAKPNRSIFYLGNNLYPPTDNIQLATWPAKTFTQRFISVNNDKKWYHIHNIDASIFIATVKFFEKIGAEWVNLPITTKMISSPGELYAGHKLNYTTDALPIEISDWFNTKQRVFLSESSQFYLELRLMIDRIDKVFSIYNSLRKEVADFTHLSEFQHIEFEGHMDFEDNIKIFTNLLDNNLSYLLKHNEKDLIFFLSKKGLSDLSQSFKKRIYRASFAEVLDALFRETRDERYKKFSMENFGVWEEILITQLYKGHVLVTNFPLLQIPFYHNESKKKIKNVSTAENADLILQGYRETIGSGTRITNSKLLKQKAKYFNIPIADYKPYVQIRQLKKYRQTSGFGLGWQRFTHWLLKLPYIWETTHIPRGHTIPSP